MSSMDLRQAFAGLLTLSMFIMLGNMIKKDHFDYSINDVDIEVSEHESVAVTEPSFATVSHLSKKSLKKNDQGLKPCWNPPPLKEVEQSKGFILFSLTNGPEYHISQIADAVVVARYLGATLVLPHIKSSKSGHTMSLGDIYDVENVLNKLNGLVKVTRTLPPQVSNRNTPIIRVPNKVSQDYIMKKVKPIYKAKGIIKIESYFPSGNNTTMGRNKNNLDSLTCKAMFGTLELKSEIEEVAESIAQKLQTWSQESSGKFIAVDLRIDVLKKECNGKDEKGRKQCFQGHEIGEFLKKIGFGQETVVYVTQTKWSPDLNALRYMFPKTYTKENIMSATKKEKFLSSESIEFEKVIDFYICSQSDIFVPSIPGPFYDNVAGKRIVSGKNQILVPSEIVSPSASASEHFSPYVTQKSHFAYACFC